jgi:hypothetical protein
MTVRTIKIDGAEVTYRDEGMGAPVIFLRGALARRHLMRVERATLVGASPALPMEMPDAFDDAILRFLADK